MTIEASLEYELTPLPLSLLSNKDHKMNKANKAIFSNTSMDAPILPANFLEKYVGKSKEQNAGKIGGKLEKWAPRNGSLAHFV